MINNILKIFTPLEKLKLRFIANCLGVMSATFFLTGRADSALAQIPSDVIKKYDPLAQSYGTQEDSVWNLINHFLNLIPYFLGGFALVAILYSAWIYVTSIGDEAKMESAKKNITWVVIGVVAVALFYIIVQVVVNVAQPSAIG